MLIATFLRVIKDKSIMFSEFFMLKHGKPKLAMEIMVESFLKFQLILKI